MTVFDQHEFEIRCEWGENGIAQLGSMSDAIVIVDVMSFSTCVAVATSRGASVYPYRFNDPSAQAFADSTGAELAKPRGEGKYSLSPASLIDIPAGTCIVLPSPNGSTLTLATGDTPALTGCLRNCRAVAETAMRIGKRISVIPAGERWKNDQTLRPAYEDLIGAGAIIDHLEGKRSPEAEAAVAAYQHSQGSLFEFLTNSVSGKELTEMGYEDDIRIIAELNVDKSAPVLVGGAFSSA